MFLHIICFDIRFPHMLMTSDRGRLGVAPAALLLDVARVGAGAERAGVHASLQAVAGQVRHVVELSQGRAVLQYHVDAVHGQAGAGHGTPFADRSEHWSRSDAGSVQPGAQRLGVATRPVLYGIALTITRPSDRSSTAAARVRRPPASSASDRGARSQIARARVGAMPRRPSGIGSSPVRRPAVCRPR